MQGRFHFYEGYPQALLALGVRTMKRLGVEKLLITNAAGGINFPAGTLMLISDHINLSGTNPLIGENLASFGPRFPDLSNVYDRALRTKLKELAAADGIPLAEGVYLMMSGPCYETPAEIRMARVLGADAVDRAFDAGGDCRGALRRQGGRYFFDYKRGGGNLRSAAFPCGGHGSGKQRVRAVYAPRRSHRLRSFLKNRTWNGTVGSVLSVSKILLTR